MAPRVQARRGRRGAQRTRERPLSSITELSIYGLLAAFIAAGILVGGGAPWWSAAAVIGGALALVGLLASMASRFHGGRTRRTRSTSTEPQAGGRGGRGRRRKR